MPDNSPEAQMAIAVILNALRWSNNILVEVQSNHSEHLSPKDRNNLRVLIDKQAELDRSIRFGDYPNA